MVKFSNTIKGIYSFFSLIRSHFLTNSRSLGFVENGANFSGNAASCSGTGCSLCTNPGRGKYGKDCGIISLGATKDQETVNYVPGYAPFS